MKSTRTFRGVIAVAAALSLLAAACGDDDTDATDATEAEAAARCDRRADGTGDDHGRGDGRHDHGRAMAATTMGERWIDGLVRGL